MAKKKRRKSRGESGGAVKGLSLDTLRKYAAAGASAPSVPRFCQYQTPAAIASRTTPPRIQRPRFSSGEDDGSRFSAYMRLTLVDTGRSGIILRDPGPPETVPLIQIPLTPEMPPKECADCAFLLDLAEAEGLRPDYSCRSGICQTCTTKLVSGKVAYLEPPMAAPKEGEVLLCCAYPRPQTGIDESVDETSEGIILDL